MGAVRANENSNGGDITLAIEHTSSFRSLQSIQAGSLVNRQRLSAFDSKHLCTEADYMNVQFCIEVSGHNFESFSDLRFLYGRGMVFYQVFLLSPLQCTVTLL
jgi:hypothetical protein